jgi:hypothetical protein
MSDDVYRSADYARRAVDFARRVKMLSENSSKAEHIACLSKAEREALIADFSLEDIEKLEHDCI